jgi:hypothetical protein
VLISQVKSNRGDSVMFGFGKNENMDKIYARLNEEIYFGKKSAEQVISKHIIKELQTYTTDIETIVAMAGIAKQAQFAGDFIKTVNYIELIKEFKETALKQGISFKEVFDKEVDGQVDSAKKYGEELTKKFEKNELDGSSRVRDFCSEYTSDMMVIWTKYRLKMRDAANYQD